MPKLRRSPWCRWEAGYPAWGIAVRLREPSNALPGQRGLGPAGDDGRPADGVAGRLPERAGPRWPCARAQSDRSAMWLLRWCPGPLQGCLGPSGERRCIGCGFGTFGADDRGRVFRKDPPAVLRECWGSLGHFAGPRCAASCDEPRSSTLGSPTRQRARRSQRRCRRLASAAASHSSALARIQRCLAARVRGRRQWSGASKAVHELLAGGVAEPGDPSPRVEGRASVLGGGR